MADMTQWGDKTSRAVIHKSESHKLHHAFPVAANKTIKAGQPVVLKSDGTIAPFEATDKAINIIGYAVTDSVNPAYQASRQADLEVTVALRGQAITYGVAAAQQDAGPVTPDGKMDSTGRYASYKAALSTDTAALFYALNAADAAGDLIQVIIA